MKLNYKVFGEGPPVVILHGLFGMLDNWQSFAKKLARQHRVYIVDQRNHGRSPHSDTFSYSLLANDLKIFVDSHNITKADFIGHSMGGKSVMQFAHDFPELCKTISIIDIAPADYSPGHLSIFDAVLNLPLSDISNRKEADAILSNTINDWGVRQFLLKNLTRSSEGFAWKANFNSLYDNYSEIIKANEFDKEISVPTLFVRGTKSNYITKEHEELIAEMFNEFRIVEIIAGHWIHAEAQEELLSTINNYINARY